ncbi:Ent-kaurene synthase 5, chloroplastic [Linum perenne]
MIIANSLNSYYIHSVDHRFPSSFSIILIQAVCAISIFLYLLFVSLQTTLNSLCLFPLFPCAAKCRKLGSQFSTEFSNATLSQRFDDPVRIQRLKKMFEQTQLAVSAYDTAWMAMVPSQSSAMDNSPFFPQCARWILDNQFCDGSWGLPLPHRHPSLTKDALSSTLACILALHRWGLGEQQVTKGLRFLELNSASLEDHKQQLPVGFDIIFPGMIENARQLGLNLPFKSTDIDNMLTKRNLELTSGFGRNVEGRKIYLAYVSEGIQHSQDWEMVMKYQRMNGSLFNSPSTTAVAFSQLQDPHCLRYLCTLLEKFENAVPTIYPLEIRPRLSIVDNLDRLGVARYFTNEIKMVLDHTYQCWLRGDEELFLDPTTCAVAFRLLRVYGYDVSSEDCFFNSLQGYLKDTTAILELHRASQIIYLEEPILEAQNAWTRNFLQRQLSDGSINADQPGGSITTKVHDALNHPYHVDLDRFCHRRSIDHYNIDNTWISKTSYCCPNVENKELIILAAQDFNSCQSIHQEELKQLGRWVMEKRLDRLSFARQKLEYCYFSAAATLYAPELSDARISWAKNGVLTTVVDDFFDVAGSMDELVNLVQLLDKWEVNGSPDFCSEKVEILFTAIHSTICEIGDKALAYQGRDVTSHILDIWVELVKSMLKEAEWTRNKWVPTMEEYMKNGYVSFALGPIVLPALYLVGPKLTEETVSSEEYKNMFESMSTCGRLLNDLRGFKMGSDEVDAVALLHGGGGGRSIEEVMDDVKIEIERERKKLLKLVLEDKENEKGIPRCCKEPFWKMGKVLHLFYNKDDGFTNTDLVNAASSIVNDPIPLSP